MKTKHVLILTLVSFVALAAIALMNSSFLGVKSVTVEGQESLSAEEIIVESAIVVGEPLDDLDIDVALAAVERLPKVEEAEISKSWTGSVKISVVERKPAAVLASTDGGFVVVGAQGHQLEKVDEVPAGLEEFTSIEIDPEIGASTSALVQSLVNVGVAMPAELKTVLGDPRVGNIRDREVILADLNRGGVVNFGDDTLLEAKMIALKTVLAQVELDCLDTISVVVPENPTVTRDPTCEGR